MGGKVFVKNAGDGNRGSTSGLRFNPREAPEFVEEDRNLGTDDAAGKEKDDRRKRDLREKRHKKIKDMKHVSLPVKNKKRPTGDSKRNDEELSEMTGPASSTGAPLDAATGARTGTGSAMGGAPVNIMTGEPMTIWKKEKRSKQTRHGKTATVHSTEVKRRRGETKRLRAKRGGSIEESRHNAKKGELPRNNSTRPDLLSTQMKGLTQRTYRTGGIRQNRQLPARGRKWGGSPTWQIDPRTRNIGINRERKGRGELTGRVAKGSLGLGEQTGGAAGTKTYGGTSTALAPPKQPKQPYQSGVARTVAGMDMGTHQSTSPSGMASGFATASPIGPAAVATSLDTLNTKDLLYKKQLSQGDLLEIRQLVREMRRLMRSGMFKKAGFEDAEHDDERPSPNAHRTTTSNPTGATETDPDDDPRYWGAHPIGLLLPRRGGHL